MKKLRNVVLIVGILVIALFTLQNTVKASDDETLNFLTNFPSLEGNNTNSGTQNTNTNTPAVNTNVPVNNTHVVNNTESLPQTGLTEDITIMFFIIVCVAIAIFAYVKIRKYNEK